MCCLHVVTAPPFRGRRGRRRPDRRLVSFPGSRGDRNGEIGTLGLELGDQLILCPRCRSAVCQRLIALVQVGNARHKRLRVTVNLERHRCPAPSVFGPHPGRRTDFVVAGARRARVAGIQRLPKRAFVVLEPKTLLGQITCGQRHVLCGLRPRRVGCRCWRGEGRPVFEGG